MTEADENRFLDVLRTKADIQLFVASAPTAAQLTIDRLPPRRSAARTFYIWNRRFPWTPDVAKATNGATIIRDILQAPVLEYGRDSFRATGDVGRIFWSKGMTPGGPYSFENPAYTYAYDATAFARWYDEVTDWIKANSRPKKSERLGTIYYLPAAWRWHGWYARR